MLVGVISLTAQSSSHLSKGKTAWRDPLSPSVCSVSPCRPCHQATMQRGAMFLLFLLSSLGTVNNLRFGSECPRFPSLPPSEDLFQPHVVVVDTKATGAALHWLRSASTYPRLITFVPDSGFLVFDTQPKVDHLLSSESVFSAAPLSPDHKLSAELQQQRSRSCGPKGKQGTVVAECTGGTGLVGGSRAAWGTKGSIGSAWGAGGVESQGSIAQWGTGDKGGTQSTRGPGRPGHTGPAPEAARIATAAGEALEPGPAIWVQLVDLPHLRSRLAQLLQDVAPAVRFEAVPNEPFMRLWCAAECLGAVVGGLAHQPEVLWIEADVTHHAQNRFGRGIVQSGRHAHDLLNAAGLDGEGEIFGASDSGIDHDHCFFHDPVHNVPFMFPAGQVGRHRSIARYDYQVCRTGPRPTPASGKRCSQGCL